ncbi:MAG: hypothetical protein OHK0039_25980 [Bacteroidia bacterium]
MQLDLKVSGREINDAMLRALQDFLRVHDYEGNYHISIEQTDSPADAQSSPAAAQAQIRVRPRTAAPAAQVAGFKLAADQDQGPIKFRRRH